MSGGKPTMPPGIEAAALSPRVDRTIERVEALEELRRALRSLSVFERYVTCEREIRTETVRRARERVEAVGAGLLLTVPL